mmetsp:Transcript_2520/g.3202  ORF Transcript_2520/g.3202 Transcript_2520/m.3202 type:complete len:279 (+) Transcript_2520:326-1162(+)|eukprot:CAMPEP_0204854196 /NCGR_PEP_ID=MMETSP1347-20130617/14821_1 /ASSEMBLY_ACC=CAM_ASM_000690 /TAXON_ID=215587 /ORGANISM="Aplanochytrium stocchinoi, Strain GSBS06" /LENGTH=278 /DNA_ID=CAMNT_0051999647 /DNA_START=29 /DNA_END=865 /DNA_ORIENTATION=+
MKLLETKVIDAKVRHSLYAGGIYVLRQLPSLVELCVLADKKLVRSRVPEEEVVDICSLFEKDRHIFCLFANALREAGVDLETTFADRLRLRIQQPGGKVDAVGDNKYGTGRFSSTLPLHRDTWASNVMCQLNWWAPLAKITANRTLQIFPKFMSKPVSNSSEIWSLKTLREKRKNEDQYPQMPVCTAVGSELEGIHLDSFPVVIEPGDMLVFSSAHLHSSVPNTSELPRFSTEIRTVDSIDFVNNDGAVNVDGLSNDYPHKEWFKNLASSLKGKIKTL